MEKRKKIYMATMIISVVTIMFTTTLLMNQSTPSVSASQVDFQEVFNKNLVSRDITPEISKVKNFLGSAELPESTETVTNVRKKVENALNAWAECQEIINSKNLTLKFNSGKLYVSAFEDALNGIYFDFSLIESDEGKIVKQCRKIALPTEVNNKRNTLYKIYFNDDFNIGVYEDTNGKVYFYPSGSIENVYYDKPDGIRYSINWSEGGKIIRQGSYDKNNKDPLLVEAEENAKKKITEFQESAQKEYEEYKRKLNNEEIDSSSNEEN